MVIYSGMMGKILFSMNFDIFLCVQLLIFSDFEGAFGLYRSE